MNIIRTKKRGFTLIELLVVCGIIAILATITTVSFIQAQSKSRDSRRKSDLETISQAVIMYKSEYGKPPEISPSHTYYGVLLSNTGNIEYTNFKNAISKYLPEIPHDPRLGRSGVSDYFYYRTNVKYRIMSILENKSDADFKECKIWNINYDYAVPDQDYSADNCFNT